MLRIWDGCTGTCKRCTLSKINSSQFYIIALHRCSLFSDLCTTYVMKTPWKHGCRVQGPGPCPASPVQHSQTAAMRNLLSQQPVSSLPPLYLPPAAPKVCQGWKCPEPYLFHSVPAAFKKQTLGATAESIKKQQQEERQWGGEKKAFSWYWSFSNWIKKCKSNLH